MSVRGGTGSTGARGDGSRQFRYQSLAKRPLRRDFKRADGEGGEVKIESDDDRVRLATKSGEWMLGPLELQRCAKHKKRWETYRWTWRVGSGPEDGEPEIVRDCVECAREVEW